MNFITKLIKKFVPNQIPIPNGRWKVEYCNIAINKKIDMANEDHCGPCGQYAKNQIDVQNKIVTKNPNV